MATISSATTAVFDRFVEKWADRTPYYLGNEGPAVEPSIGTSWARASINHLGQPGADTLGPVGGRKFVRNASLFVQIFTPLDDGRAVSDALVEVVKTNFEGVRLSGDGVWFNEALVREQPPDGPWNVVLVECLFAYEETK